MQPEHLVITYQVTGAQNWDDEAHTFGEDPFFNGLVNFADNQAFPKGTSFVSGQTFESAPKIIPLVLVWTLQGEKLLEKPEPLVKVLTFQLHPDDMGTFANIFNQYMHMPPAQAFTVAQTMGEHMHFGDNTDFTAAEQVFAQGAHFGDGTTFKVGQSFTSRCCSTIRTDAFGV